MQQKAQVKKNRGGGKPVSNSAQIDAKNPIPFEYGGQSFAFRDTTKYIPFLHPDDNFAQTLLEARLLSTTQAACIDTKRDFCTGSLVDTAGAEFDSKITEWLQSLNLKNENARAITRAAFESHFQFGNTPIELVRFSVGGKKRFFIYVHNFLEWRLAAPDEDGIVREAVQSKLFLRRGIVSSIDYKTSRTLPIYNPMESDRRNWLKVKGSERTLLWYKNAAAGYDHYGMPSSVSSLIYQVLEYKAARYNLDNFDNNMVIGGILALKGSLGQGEANRIGREIIKTHTGDGKRGRTAVVASEEGIEKSDFHEFNTTKDGSFKESDEIWSQKIIFANQWDAVLAGLISGNSIGKGAGFLSKIFEVKNNTVIRPAQEDLVEKVWTPIMKLAGDYMGFDSTKYTLGIKSNKGISAVSDIDITPAVKVNEAREAAGLPLDESPNGEMYLGQLKQPATGSGGGNNV
jgi:hypothetical protein